MKKTTRRKAATKGERKKKIEKLFFDFDKWSIVVDEK